MYIAFLVFMFYINVVPERLRKGAYLYMLCIYGNNNYLIGVSFLHY